jgi:dipeptidyl aminopeptidase/acylaminoacyl peptidase
MCLAFAPDGKTLAVASNKRCVQRLTAKEEGRREDVILWDLTRRKPARTIPIGAYGAYQIAFAPDSKTLAVSKDATSEILLCDAETGVKRGKLERIEDLRNGKWELAFSPDGRTLAAVAQKGDGIFQLWDVQSKQVKVVIQKDSPIRRIAFSPDGRTLATAHHDCSFRVWEMATLKPREYLTVPGGTVHEIAFSPDGRTLATLEDPEDLIKFWDVFSNNAKQPDAAETLRLWKVLAGEQAAIAELLQTAREDRLRWAVQTGEDAAVAYWAIRRFIAYPEQTLPLFRKHLHAAAPPSGPPKHKIEGWVADLNSDAFAKREQAAEKLNKCGVAAEDALRRALTGKESLEVRRRVKAILEPIEQARIVQQLQEGRAVEVLEHIGTAEAQAFLEELAKGVPEARLTQEAKASLARLKKRPVAKP